MSAEPLFGPGWGNYAIQGIVELTLPEPVSMLPHTPGWWLLLALVVGAAVAAARRRRQRWLNNRYRRDALERLVEIQTRLADDDRSALRELAPLLRATALTAGDRAALTRLSGPAWQDAVNAMAPDLTPVPVLELERLAYEPLTTDRAIDDGALIDALRAWISGHISSHA